jgi:hypothetical protein
MLTYVVVMVAAATVIDMMFVALCSCYGDDCGGDRYAVALCSCYGDDCDVD